MCAHLVLQVPDTILVGELLVAGAALGQDAALEAAHVEQQVGVVLAVHGHKAVLPLDGGDGAGQPVLDVPEHRTAAGRVGGERGGDILLFHVGKLQAVCMIALQKRERVKNSVFFLLFHICKCDELLSLLSLGLQPESRERKPIGRLFCT